MVAKYPNVESYATYVSKYKYNSVSKTQMGCGDVVSEEATGKSEIIANALSARLTKAKAGVHQQGHNCS